MNAVLKEWLSEVENEGPELLWSVSNDTEGLPSNIEEWHEFFNRIDSHINSICSEPILLYVWFDEQARHLRFASNYCTPETLPFGCTVNIEPKLENILTQWQESPSVIEWSELSDSENESTQEPENFTVNVWVCSAGD